MIKKLVQYITDPTYRFVINDGLHLYNNMPDEAYLRRKFKAKMGKPLDLDSPKTFNEKMQWLKLYNRKPEYTTMVDKYEAKKYVAERIGEEYIIPTLGVWDRFDDIDFDALPNQFVLKCTHDSGGLVICRDKKTFDYATAKKNIEKSLKRNYYLIHREWPYKDVPHRIIAEQYMEDTKTAGLLDYKFFCFNGEPEFLYVSQGLEDHSTARISFLTMKWQFAPYLRSDFKPFEELPPKPMGFDKMVEIARTLSQEHDFLRVDLYQIGRGIYFSELTFSPCAGFMPFEKPEHDLEIGNMMRLSKKT